MTAIDREIVVTRTFDAPRDLLFDTWINPRHLSSWWGPNGFQTTIHEMDVRPGGTWRLTMHGPGGRDYKNRIIFIEVAKPARLVYKNEPEEGSEPVSFETTVTFEERDGKTKVTVRMVFPSAGERDHTESQYHALEGGNQMLDRLAGFLSMTRQEVTITRIINAPREVVFKAWIDADQLKQWWGPKGFTNPVCELDPRPGGAIRIHMRAPDGVVYPMTGKILELVEPERLVFSSAALDKEGNAMFENLNTVTFAEQGAQTKLTLHTKVMTATEQAAAHLRGMEEGWKLTLDRLTEFVK